MEALAGAVADGFASVLAAIGMVQADTETIMAELGHVESGLAAVDGDLQAIDADLMAIDGDLQALDSDLQDINSNLQGVQNDLQGLSGAVGGSAASFASLADTVQSNSVAINDLSAKLDMISEAVGAVQQTVDTPPAEEVSSVGLMKGKSTYEVKLQDFGDSVPQGDAPNDNTYEVTHTLVCEADISVDNAMVSAPIAPLGGTAVGATTDAATVSIAVGVNTLYTTNFVPTAATTTPVIYHQSADFDLMHLPAGLPFAFTSVTTVGNTANAYGLTDPAPDTPFSINDYVNTDYGKNITVANTEDDAVTRMDAGDADLYTITVTWLSGVADPKCSITSSSDTSPGLTQVDETVLVPLTVTGDGILKQYEVEVDCGHQETLVTDVRIEGVVVLPEHASMTLSAGDEMEKLDLSVGDDGVITASNIGFKFNNANMTVTGALTGSAIAQFTYDTVDDNECTT